DMVTVTMNTFTSLTAQCARCHNHKFDPIQQEDYYSLQAVFAAVDRADRPYPAPSIPPATQPKNSPALVYAAATEFAPQGTFTPTHGKPRPIYLLHRGSEKEPREEMNAGTIALASVPDLPARFKFADPQNESQPRAAL